MPFATRPIANYAGSTCSLSPPSTASTKNEPSPRSCTPRRLGLFELSWNVLCPGCGGVLDASTTLKTVNRDEYDCGLCAGGYKPTLDEMVEVTFTVSPRVRRIAAPRSGVRCPKSNITGRSSGVPASTCRRRSAKASPSSPSSSIELPPGEKAVLSVQLPAEFVIVFDPVTHGTQFIDVKGEPTRERQALSMVFNKVKAPVGTVEMRPGPLRLSLENRTDRRVLPALWIAGDALHQSARQAPAVPDRQAAADQPDLPRHLPHRHARRRPAAQDHQPDFSVHRPQGLDRALRARRRSRRLRSRAAAFRRAARDRRRRGGRRGQDHRRRGDGDIRRRPTARWPRPCACARR